MDIVVAIVSLIFLVLILKPFTFPQNEEVEDTTAIVLITIGILAYFYSIDFFSPNIPILGYFHVVTVGIANAFAIIDLFLATVLGIPLSLEFLFIIVLPAMIVFRLTTTILKYVAVFTETTIYFISLVMAFISIMAAITTNFNPIQEIFNLLVNWMNSLFGGPTPVSIVTTLFVVFVLGITLSIAFESLTVGIMSYGRGNRN